jgi:hypothetical protein
MVYVGTAEFYYTVVDSTAGGENLAFVLEFLDGDGAVVASTRYSPPPDHVGDGSWHPHRFSVDIRESRLAQRMRITFSVNDRSPAPGEWIIDDLQIYEEPPCLEFGSLRCGKALVAMGQEFQIAYDLANVGGETYYDLLSRIRFDEGLRVAGGLGVEEQILQVVEPGVDYEVVWNLVADRPGTYAIWVENFNPNLSPASSPMLCIIAAGEFSRPRERPARPVATQSAEEIVLANSRIRLVFPSSELGYGFLGVQIWEQGWTDMGAAMPIGHALHQLDSGRNELILLTPDEHRLYDSTSEASIKLTGSAEDGDGMTWEFEYLFRLGREADHVEVQSSFSTTSERRVLRLSGPQLLAGEGCFGSDRKQALFCGLEYLAEGEISSGTDFVHEPDNLRVVPHPLKITIPLMVVEHGNASIGLSWDPLQRWDGVNQLPSARFLSPNWVQNQSNHVMNIFVPSVPTWVAENEDQAHTPYNLSGEILLSMRVFARAHTGVLGAVRWWLELEGIPEVPDRPRSYQETVDLCTASYKDVCWVPEYESWKHTHRDDPSWIFWDPMVAVALWHHSALTDNQTLRDEIRQQVLQALGKRGGRGADLDLALHLGEMEKTLSSAYSRVRSLADTQNDDGSWPFTPSSQQADLGIPGDSSSGWTASMARFLLKFGRITGDSEAIAAGLKALEYLDAQVRPEGAQTWELQLHVPDVLASSYVMECYLEAYRITGDPTHLEKAKYWALTGLPFIYLWSPADRPVMRYGSIPVFGATHFTHPWFGIIVQWNGLDYAYKLLELSRYDDELPWRTLAEGITICGMQMQRYPGGPHDEVIGMYPDAYSALKGDDAYYFDINPRFISLCVFGLMGQDETTQTEILETPGGVLHVSAVGQLAGAEFTGDTLIFTNEYPGGDTSYAIVSSITKPASVRVNGGRLGETGDLSAETEGWTYRPEGMLVIKLVHQGSDLVEVVGIQPHQNQRFSAEPVWHFDEADPQGWSMANMLLQAEVANGTLRTGSTGADPFMHGPSVRFEGHQDALAELRMRITAGTQGQIFWVRKDAGGYSESKSMTFEIIPDGEFHTYKVPVGQSPEWSGIIRQLRLDPTNAEGSEIEIDYFLVPDAAILHLLILASALVGGRRVD